MKTKIFAIFTMSVLMMALTGTAVLAQEANSIQVIQLATSVAKGLSNEDIAVAIADENIKDSSGIWKDKVNRFFTFNKKRKAEISMRIAKKRMYEVGELVEAHPRKAKLVAKAYEAELNSALEHFDEISEENKEGVVTALKQNVIAKFRLENHKAKVSEIHERILENKADQMTEEQLIHLEEIFSEIEEKIDSTIQKFEERQENLIARALLISDLSEEEIRELLEHFENSLEERKELRTKHLRENKNLIKQKRAEIRARLASEPVSAAVSSEVVSTPVLGNSIKTLKARKVITLN